MHTSSRFTSRQFVPGTSKGQAPAGTFRAQMADAARGRRVKELREARGLTGPQVVELMRDLGGPKKNGDPFVSYRQYQKYEAGGGIGLDKLRVLSAVLGTTKSYILDGEGERRQPRDARANDHRPIAVDRLEGELADRITTIEQTLAQLTGGYQQILAVLSEARQEQDRISHIVEAAVAQASGERQQITVALGLQTQILGEIQDATTHARAAAGQLDEAVERAGRALRAGTPSPAPVAAKPVSSRTRRASAKDPS